MRKFTEKTLDVLTPIAFALLIVTMVSPDSNAAARSSTEKNHFKSTNHCPSNGQAKGSCPGYVVDHVVPLACGGLDKPSNMQWQTIEEGKAKDKWERKDCSRWFK